MEERFVEIDLAQQAGRIMLHRDPQMRQENQPQGHDQGNQQNPDRRRQMQTTIIEIAEQRSQNDKNGGDMKKIHDLRS